MDLIRAVQHSHLPVLSWRPALSSTSSPLHRFPKLCDVGKSCIPFRTSTSVSSRSHVRIRTLPVHAQIAAPVRIVQQAFLQFPPSWTSSLIANATIFTIGLPILQTGLTASGMASAYLLGTSTWRAFGASGFLVVAAYFVLVTIQGAAICIVASQLANLFESYAGATLQDTDGLKWLNNDVINVLNISFGAALAILFQKINLL